MLYVSSGHSKFDSGAVANNTTEYKEVKRICNDIVSYLKDSYEVKHIDDSLSSTISLLLGTMKVSDIAIECHLDSSLQNPTATGATLFYNATRPEDIQFGERFLNSYCTQMGMRNRGVLPDTKSRFGKLGFVRTGKSYLLELGFISNIEDLEKVRSKGAISFTNAFLEAVGLSKEENLPDWGKEIWLKSKELNFISKKTKFFDSISKGELMVILSRMFPDKFNS